MWNFSGSLATSAARSSLGKANPIDRSSGEIETKTSLPTRKLTWSRISRSSLRGSDPAYVLGSDHPRGTSFGSASQGTMETAGNATAPHRRSSRAGPFEMYMDATERLGELLRQ